MQLVGSSEAIQRVKAHAAKFAKSRKQVILLTGESGSGKGAVAEYIHSLTGKAKEKFISISVAGLDDNLANSELFGHEKGAFTNALYKHDGAFAQASDGTLFLDEIGDATLPVQLRLLKAIEERKFYSVGGTRLIYSNALVITATNQDLDQKCAAGSFRRDLLARIKTLEIRIP